MALSVGWRKSVALFLSGTFPGLGQLYNRQPIKAGAFLIGGIALSWLLGRAIPDPLALLTEPVRANVIGLLCLILALWIWSVIDAWRAAGR